MNKISGYTKHLKGYGKPITASAAAIGFISDFLQPLASYSKWILIFCAAVCVLSVPLLAFDNYRKHVVSAYVYSLLTCLICGPLYYIQLSGYSQYGVFAYIFPKVHTLQNSLGITKQLANISTNVIEIKGDVSKIKEEVTKSFEANQIITLVKKANTERRVQLLYDFERYPIHGPLTPKDFIEIYRIYPNNYKEKVVHVLGDSLSPSFSAQDYFALIEKNKGIQGLFWDLGRKLKANLSATEIINHLETVPPKYRDEQLRCMAEFMKPMSARDMINLVKMSKGDANYTIITLLSRKNTQQSSVEDIYELKRLANNTHISKLIDGAFK